MNCGKCVQCFDRDVGGWDPGWGGPEIRYGCDVDGEYVRLEDNCRFEIKDESILQDLSRQAKR